MRFSSSLGYTEQCGEHGPELSGLCDTSAGLHWVVAYQWCVYHTLFAVFADVNLMCVYVCVCVCVCMCE